MLEHLGNVKGKNIGHSVLFEVYSEDHVYRIFTDGKTEGFPKGSLINNWFPTHVLFQRLGLNFGEEYVKADALIASYNAPTTGGPTSTTPIGEEHRVPA